MKLCPSRFSSCIIDFASMKEAPLSIPHLFRCPISLDLLKDPVTLCTGQTYDRSSIEKWLATGNLTCPITMQKLHDPSIVPNHTLRHLIHQWLQMSKQIDPDYITTVDSLISLKTQLESPCFVLYNKLPALQRVQILSKESSCMNSRLLQLGFLQVLLELVFGHTEENLSLEQAEIVEIALSCALDMHPHRQKEALNILKQDCKMSSFIVLLQKGTNAIKARLCDLIEGVSSSPESKDLCLMLGNSPRVVRETIAFLHQNDSELSNSGAKAINSLCKYESNIENLLREGADKELLGYISRAEAKMLVPESMAALEKLLGARRGKEGLKSPPLNGIQALVKMMFKVSDEGHGMRESAVNSLMILCSESTEAREEAIRGGVLSQLLLLLQSQCSARIKARARMFLKLLRSKWAEDIKNM